MSESANNGGAQTASENSGISVNVFGRTDVGLVRDHNEDNFIIADLSRENRSIKPEVRAHTVGPQGSLFAVCDGMGGAAAGEVASQIAVDTIYEQMQEGWNPRDDAALATKLDNAIIEAGERIYTAARVNRRRRGMGTTVTAAVLIGPRLIIGQVGDSRAYISRQGRFVQLTKDQSLVQQLIDAKQLTEEEARDFDKNNIILQALGTSENVLVDMTSAILRRGDVLVMCSDGLCGLVSDDEIAKVVAEIEDPMESCRRLTDMARDAGGHDNITVIVVVFGGDELLLPGSSGDGLEYKKYKYSGVGDVTSRASNPLLADRETQPAVKDKKPQDPIATGQKQEEEIADPVPEKQKVQAGLLSAAVAALLVGIALIVYIVTLNSRSDDSAAGDTVELVDDDVAPVENKAEELKNNDTFRPAVTPVKAETSRPGSGQTGDIEMDDAPTLAPTPEGAIIGRNPISGTAKTGKKGTRKKDQLGGSPGDMEEKKLEEQAATPVPETSGQHKKVESDKKDGAEKKVAPAKKSTPKKISPKKLDDNPF